MFHYSKLLDEQLDSIHEWAAGGADLQEIQKRVGSEFGFNITYMDTRMLILDLGIDITKPLEEPHEVAEIAKSEGGLGDQEIAETDSDIENDDVDESGTIGEVRVSLDQLPIPGALMSGKVSFSDGQKGRWYLDQSGRLGIDPDATGYEPSLEDLAAFREELLRMAR